jgi:hypothetical protein
MSPRRKDIGKKAQYLQNIHLTVYFVKKLTIFMLFFSNLSKLVNFLLITPSDSRQQKEDKSTVFYFPTALFYRYYRKDAIS